MTTYKHFATLLLALAFSSICLYGQTDSLLQRYQKTAAIANPGLQARFYRYQAALQDLPQASALPDPQLRLAYYLSPVETRTGARQLDLQLTQLFPWFGSLKARREVAALEAEARYHQFLIARNELYYQVERWYSLLYLHQQKIKITRRQLALIKRLEELSRPLLSGATTSQSQLLRLKMERREKENQLARWQRDLQSTLAEMRALLHRPESDSLRIPDTLWLPPLPRLSATSVEAHPQMGYWEQQAAVARQEAVVARKNGMPQLGLGLNYGLIRPRNDAPGLTDNGRDVLAPAATLSLPLFRKKYRAAGEAAQFREQAALADRQATHDRLQAEAESFYWQLLSAQADRQLYQSLLQDVQQIKQLQLKAFAGDEARFQNLYELDQLYLDYRLALAQAHTDYAIANAAYRAVQGQFITSENPLNDE